jgi:hypothetical protein
VIAMVDIATVAIIGAVAVGGIYVLKSVSSGGGGIGGIGVNFPAINLPSFAMNLPSFDFGGISKSFTDLGTVFGGMVANLSKGIAGFGTGIGSGIASATKTVSGDISGTINNAVATAGGLANTAISNVSKTVNKVVDATLTGVSWVAPVGVGAVVAGPIGAVVGLAGRAGWAIGSSSANPIANAIKGVVGYSQNMLYQISNISTGQVISSFGASSLDRAKSLMSQAYGAGWSGTYKIIQTGKA